MPETPIQNSNLSQIGSSVAVNYPKPELLADDSKGVVIFLNESLDIVRRNIADFLSHWTSRIVQNIGTIFFRVLFHSFFKMQIKGAKWMRRAHGPALIVSNHIAPYDSFMFHLFFRIGSPLLPLRFMGVLKFSVPFLNFLSRIGVVQVIYLLFGVFVIIQGEGVEKALVNARRILKQGGTVVIFPEGRMSRNGQIGEFKQGAAILAKETGVQVIPVSVKKTKRAVRNLIHINVGKPFAIEKSMSTEDAIQKMRDTVLNLHSLN